MPNISHLLGQQYSPIGLEMSRDAIRMIQVKINGGKWTLHRVAQKEFYLQEQELKDLSDELAREIKTMKEEHGFYGRQVVSTLSNRDVDILPVRLQVADTHAIEGKIIENARTRLSYRVDQAVIDYLPLDSQQRSPEGMQSFWIIASQRAVVDQHLSLIRAAGLHIKALDIQPCALIRSILETGYEISGNVLLIHMGERESLFLFFKKEGLLAQRMYLMGHLNMVDKLVEILKIERSEGVRLLSHYGFINPAPYKDGNKWDKPDPTMSTVHEIILPAFKNLLESLKDFVNYCLAEGREMSIETIFLSGNVAQIRNIDRMIEHHSDIPTQIINPLSLIDAEDGALAAIDQVQGSQFTMSLGLTLRA